MRILLKEIGAGPTPFIVLLYQNERTKFITQFALFYANLMYIFVGIVIKEFK